MNVKTVSVTYERKANLGDFNSAQVGVTLWADVSDGEDLDVAMRSLWAMAKENVKAQLLPLVKGANPANVDAKELYLGIPVKKE